MSIQENQELVLKNALSFRGKVTQSQMHEEMIKIGNTMKKLGVVQNGPITTATFSVEQENGEQLLDVEILVPLDKQVKLPEGYIFKPLIRLVNALYIRHIGNPAKLANTIGVLNEYIISNNKQIITATYNVSVKEATSIDEIDNTIIDIYVGCNPSIL